MHITEIYAGHLPPLEDVGFHCDERVNLFIGPNASGKSTILRAIRELHSMASLGMSPYQQFKGIQNPNPFDGSTSYSDEVNYVTPGGGIWFGMEVSEDWPRDDSGGAIWKEMPLLYIPSTRISLPGQHIFAPHTFHQALQQQGDSETDTPLKRLFDTELGVFDGRYVELAIEWLRKELIGSQLQQRSLREALNHAHLCAKRICAEVIRDYSSSPYVEEYETSDTKRVVHHGMGVNTDDATYFGEQPLYAGALSSGTQGTLLWVYALALKIGEHYGFDEYWWGEQEKPAILLIDEIENHLHPTWQRRVIPALLEHFPGLQIFATTHSPFVVAGLKAGQVHLLKRDENGFVTATTYLEDIVGWTADEILRNMMGVEDPTDNETAAAARELRQLRNEGPRSAPEEEEARQRRIQELRQLVDRDLLAGGPWKKQRELFEQQFAEALQKYRQSQGLNQENG